MEILIASFISILIQVVKKIYKDYITEDWQNILTILTLLLFSVVSGFVMFYLKQANLWDSAVQIALYSSGVWALIIRQFEKNE